MNVAIQIPSGTYGLATDAVDRLLRIADSFEWFRKRTPDHSVIFDLQRRLMQRLGVSVPDARMLITVGDLREAAALYRAANPIEDDPAYARGRWRSLLSEAFMVVSQISTSDPDVRRRFVPPLFPFAGNAGVCGATLVAHRDELVRSVGNNDFNETIWYLMCDVENDFWSAIISEIAGRRTEAEIFNQLLELYVAGCYPVGFIQNRFISFVHA